MLLSFVLVVLRVILVSVLFLFVILLRRLLGMFFFLYGFGGFEGWLLIVNIVLFFMSVVLLNCFVILRISVFVSLLRRR